MYYDKFLPFYLTYASPALYSGERMQEREFALMKSYFPDTALKVQEKVEEECELLDYEGSRLYDEYPDRLMMRSLCRQIREQVAGELELQEISDRSASVSGDFQKTLQTAQMPGILTGSFVSQTYSVTERKTYFI